MKKRIFLKLFRMGILNILPSKLYLKIKYKIYFNRRLNFRNPQTFNEKLQWLKINDRKENYTDLVDKYQVKKIICNLIGDEHIIKTIGIYDKYDEIDFSKLPNKFVMKCTHDSGGIVICKDKNSFNHIEARKKIEDNLKKNYFWLGREWPYKKVKPRIIIEEYIETPNGESPNDYKFFCFNGEPKCYKIDFDRFKNHGANYYDVNGNLLPFGEVKIPPNFDKKIEQPKNIDIMLDFAKKLSKNIPFVRVDFYEVNEKVLFGEMTFYPASGMGKFTDESADILLGEWLKIK